MNFLFTLSLEYPSSLIFFKATSAAEKSFSTSAVSAIWNCLKSISATGARSFHFANRLSDGANSRAPSKLR